MDYKKYYGTNHTYITDIDHRLKKVIDIVKNTNPKHVLDVGCGSGTLLKALHAELPKAKLYGTDVYKPKNNSDWDYVVSDVTEKINFKNNTFDVVVAGEIIEHVPDPDFLIQECSRVLKKDGVLIITTPNLVSWANRLLVLTGTQPLFTETSTKMNLGRRHKLLGQGSKVQGHLKIFTHKSLKETAELNGMKMIDHHGSVFFFPFPVSLIDKAFSKFVSTASNLIIVLKKDTNAVASK